MKQNRITTACLDRERRGESSASSSPPSEPGLVVPAREGTLLPSAVTRTRRGAAAGYTAGGAGEGRDASAARGFSSVGCTWRPAAPGGLGESPRRPASGEANSVRGRGGAAARGGGGT